MNKSLVSAAIRLTLEFLRNPANFNCRIAMLSVDGERSLIAVTNLLMQAVTEVDRDE